MNKWSDTIENNRLLAVYTTPAGRVIGRVLATPISYGRKTVKTCYPFYAFGIHGGGKTFTEAKELVERIAPVRYANRRR